jgi:hypothetical protein
MEFNVCPQGHKRPDWWTDPSLCLFCDYGGLEKLREKIARGEMCPMQTNSANQPDTGDANKEITQTDDVCSCGKPKRPRGSDCWTCYRRRSD